MMIRTTHSYKMAVRLVTSRAWVPSKTGTAAPFCERYRARCVPDVQGPNDFGHFGHMSHLLLRACSALNLSVQI